MKEEIELSPEQIRRIEDVYQRMKRQAIPLGLELIELERKLNNRFANGTITETLRKRSSNPPFPPSLNVVTSLP
jgi:hypothetical protein